VTSTDVMARLEQRLLALSAEHPELAADLAHEARLLRATLQAPHPPRTPLPALPRERLMLRLGAGIPVLHDEPLFVDVGCALDLLERLVRTRERAGPAGNDAKVESVRAALLNARLDAGQVFVEAFVRHADHLAQLATGGGVDPGTLAQLAERAVAPLRRGYARALERVLESLHVWRQGYCPVCGDWPLVADAKIDAPRRGFRCGACGTSWHLADRRCPFCGTNDPGRVAVVAPARTAGPLVGVQLCEVCGRYVKVAEPIDEIPSALLGFEELGSRGLDDAALARGFARPSSTGFTLELGLPEPGWSSALADFDPD
jgi:FdhE protein